MTSALMLAAFLLVCFTAAGIGGWATASSVNTWYPGLAKPAWNPPAWVFGPVWTVLYITMAVAAWLVWRRTGFPNARTPLGWFAVQLVLNAGWSICFFGLRNPGLAVVEILLLWASILVTLICFWRVVPIAGWLMLPYLGWVTLAGALNLSLWWLNRT